MQLNKRERVVYLVIGIGIVYASLFFGLRMALLNELQGPAPQQALSQETQRALAAMQMLLDGTAAGKSYVVSPATPPARGTLKITEIVEGPVDPAPPAEAPEGEDARGDQ